MSLGNRLRLIRKQLGYTQVEMASVFGIVVSTWQTFERDQSSPKTMILEKLCDMGFDGHWVLTGKGEMLAAASSRPKGDLDEELFNRIVVGVEKFLVAHKRNLADPGRRSELYVTHYRLFSGALEDGKEPHIKDYAGVINLASDRSG